MHPSTMASSAAEIPRITTPSITARLARKEQETGAVAELVTGYHSTIIDSARGATGHNARSQSVLAGRRPDRPLVAAFR